jgi:hypothetical protein
MARQDRLAAPVILRADCARPGLCYRRRFMATDDEILNELKRLHRRMTTLSQQYDLLNSKLTALRIKVDALSTPGFSLDDLDDDELDDLVKSADILKWPKEVPD